MVFKLVPFSRLLPGPRLLYFVKSIHKCLEHRVDTHWTHVQKFYLYNLSKFRLCNTFHNKYITSHLENIGLPSVRVIIWELKNRAYFGTREFVLSIQSGKHMLLSSIPALCQKWVHLGLQELSGGTVLFQCKVITNSRQHRAGAMPLVTGIIVLIKDLSQAECQQNFQKCLTKSQRSYIAIFHTTGSSKE